MMGQTIRANVASVERDALLSDAVGDVYDIILEYDASQVFLPGRFTLSVDLGTKGFRLIGGTEGVLELQAFGEPLVNPGDSVAVVIRPLLSTL